MVTWPRYLASPHMPCSMKNVVLQDKTSSSMSVRFPNFFEDLKRDRLLPLVYDRALYQRVPILVKALSKFPLLSASLMNLPSLNHLMGNTTSKVLQTDSAYLPESLVRFLLLVQYEMLLILAALGSPVVINSFDSTATNFIGLHSIPYTWPLRQRQHDHAV